MIKILKRAWAAWLFVPFIISCATYNKSMDGYYADIKAHNYNKAQRTLEKNRLINKDRNALLFNLEMGKIYRLKNEPVKSNLYFNRADGMMESNGKTLGDIALSNLLNPMMQHYKGEDFEKFMVHYYKALNYATLGQTEDAVVEARRITLSENKQTEKYNNKENRYSKDAFALNLQGMIYEMAGDINNAFIAYRNAADVFLKSDNNYYGVKMPVQLQKDLVRTATAMGFTGEGDRYEKLFNASYSENTTEGGELILFIEQGRAPVKEEKNILVTAGANGLNSFNYVDANGNNTGFNFNPSTYGISEDKLTTMRAFRLAMPYYRIQNEQPLKISVTNEGETYSTQLLQNLNNVAVNIMQERFITDMANALARQLTKKLIEKGTQAAAAGIAKNTYNKQTADTTEAGKEKQKKVREQRADRAGEVAGFVFNMINTVTEKADTRNWQSLPAFVSYVRLPLKKGENTIMVNYNRTPIKLQVNGNGGIQMKSIIID